MMTEDSADVPATLILLSNREPYEHVHGVDAIEVRQPAGGLVTALDPTMRQTRGTWVAWGSGAADRTVCDQWSRIAVPPDDPAYTLRRVWLDDHDIEAYYLGFANSVLWPLCHMLIQHLDFREDYWDRYRDVNRRFAKAVAEEAERAEGRATVWIQDFHFALASEMIRELSPGLIIHQFWHIPFPPPDLLRLLPGGTDGAILRGLLGNDLIEFHTDRHAQNFLDCVRQIVPEAQVEGENALVHYQGRAVHIGTFPISIDVAHFERLATSRESVELTNRLRDRYAAKGRQLGISVDRLDYTKGIPQRLNALCLLWQQNPELRERFTMLIVATPSRTDVPAYRDLAESVIAKAMQINEQFRTPDWTPVVLIDQGIGGERLAAVYRAADFCVVSSLQDGMNLVSKEFIACQADERGVLLLSRFAGAAEEIEGAVLINPFDVEGTCDGILRALAMSADERRDRMRAMRAQLRDSTIFDWMGAILSRVSALAPQEGAPAQ